MRDSLRNLRSGTEQKLREEEAQLKELELNALSSGSSRLAMEIQQDILQSLQVNLSSISILVQYLSFRVFSCIGVILYLFNLFISSFSSINIQQNREDNATSSHNHPTNGTKTKKASKPSPKSTPRVKYLGPMEGIYTGKMEDLQPEIQMDLGEWEDKGELEGGIEDVEVRMMCCVCCLLMNEVCLRNIVGDVFVLGDV